MEPVCPFCAPGSDMRSRTFYEDERWFAFLAAPPNLRGHAIVAAKRGDECPQALTEGVLEGIHVALSEVARVLRAHYSPEHVLFASLRVQDPHIHLHLFPITKEQEDEWRLTTGADYQTGRFFEFLGDQEKASFNAHKAERERNVWSKDQQRLQHANVLSVDVAKLAEIARMDGTPKT